LLIIRVLERSFSSLSLRWEEIIVSSKSGGDGSHLLHRERSERLAGAVVWIGGPFAERKLLGVMRFGSVCLE
jgi:hypothetical protein